MPQNILPQAENPGENVREAANCLLGRADVFGRSYLIIHSGS